MPDEFRSPIKHHPVLHRVDPEQGVRTFYSLMIERDLFGTVRLVRNWGRIGTNGQELVEVFDTVRYPWRPRRGASLRTCHRPL
jgi:predicted DNA-binding WGR domain protein